MKGVVLAGGKGTRLRPLTKVINKHLLPVYDKPMVYFPIHTLLEAGVKDIVIVSNPEHIDDFYQLLGNGKGLGIKLSYVVQDQPSGIAHALAQSRQLVGNKDIAMVLGDNIFFESVRSSVQRFKSQPKGAKVYLKEVNDPIHFGVASLNGKKITGVVEKPVHPLSNLAVVGLYLYKPDVFTVIEHLEPSKRGELEITDVNNYYAQSGELTFQILKKDWIDAGSSLESLYRAATMVKGLHYHRWRI